MFADMGWIIEELSKAEKAKLEKMKAATYDDGKAPLSTLPWAALDEMAFVQAYGHKKYGSFYNYKKGMEVSRHISCAMRHLRDFMEGIDLDSESGRSHLGHAMVRIAYVIQNQKDGTAIDDRYKPNADPLREQREFLKTYQAQGGICAKEGPLNASVNKLPNHNQQGLDRNDPTIP